MDRFADYLLHNAANVDVTFFGNWMFLDTILLDNAADVDVSLVNGAGCLGDLVIDSLLRHGENFKRD